MLIPMSDEELHAAKTNPARLQAVAQWDQMMADLRAKSARCVEICEIVLPAFRDGTVSQEVKDELHELIIYGAVLDLFQQGDIALTRQCPERPFTPHLDALVSKLEAN